MRAGFVTFDGMTALDFVGGFDPVTRLSTMGYVDLEWDVCASAAAQTETVTAAANLRFEVDSAGESLAGYDLLFVPGGSATRELRRDDAFVSWLETAEECPVVASVCTGSLLLGAAGFLDGRLATTHPNAFDMLEEYCEVVDARVVDEGPVVTARGVASALDVGLHLVERLTDVETRREIAAQMDYPDPFVE
ncbi:DJ-1/PfpI family protein [Haloprofundus salilacus]|uniref:DJ-1/PfpI family protein n=1 Tax=Haloprofundus salilacus TaxID=2876190 RepID=UPI001CC9ED03|nr:DJ-1/PfpI family protein [Haloprofundus salilacus]